MEDGLTRRQELFCQEYITDYNGRQAAIRAGYKDGSAEVQASRMLRNANILARVRTLQAEQVARLAVSQDFVIVALVETYRRCMQAQAVLDADGGETGVYQFDSRGALRALELLGKHLGMYNDKLQISGGLNTGKLDSILEQLRSGDSG